MIFGGYGRKTKERGELIYLCYECGNVTHYRLIENYKYEHLYGVRVAKHGTQRMLVCKGCQRGWDLTKEQWNAGKGLAKELQQMPGRLTDEQVIGFCLRVANEMFPDQSPALRAMLLGDVVDEPEVKAVEELEEETATIDDSAGPVEVTDAPSTTFCPKCGFQSQTERFCPSCGMNLDDVRASLERRSDSVDS